MSELTPEVLHLLARLDPVLEAFGADIAVVRLCAYSLTMASDNPANQMSLMVALPLLQTMLANFSHDSDIVNSCVHCLVSLAERPGNRSILAQFVPVACAMLDLHGAAVSVIAGHCVLFFMYLAQQRVPLPVEPELLIPYVQRVLVMHGYDAVISDYCAKCVTELEKVQIMQPK
jgi:hypothetical protein